MTRILRLLLIAAIALPLWQPAAAQEKVLEDVKTYPANALENPQPNHDAIATEVAKPVMQMAKGSQSVNNSKLMIDYFGKGTKGSNSVAPKLKASLKAAPPATATVEEWNISTNFYNVGASGFIDFNNTIKVAIDGNNIYIQGLCLWLPEAWVQGTINGNTATFPTGQLYGTFTQNGTDYEMFFVGFDEDAGDVADVAFNYSAAAHKLTLPENIVLLIGADTDGGYYAYHINTVIAKEYVDPPVEIEIGADAVDPSAYIPIYGYYYEQSTTSQIIYPASMLSTFAPGQQIKSLTFYTYDASGIQFSGGQITATLGTTTDAYFPDNSALSVSGTTATATVVPTQGSTTLKIEFDTPIEYTEGANLILQLVNTTTGSYAQTNWLGVAYSGNTQYYSYSSRGNGSNQARRLQFLPKTTFELQYPSVSLTDELDFEVVEVGQNKTLTAFVENSNSEAVTATVTTSAPFSVASSTVTLQPGANNTIEVTFTPTEPNVYNGTLTVDINGSLVNIPLKGVGTVAGPEAIHDETFFEGITYTWKENGNGTTHTSNLSEIATDPDQIIAMLKEVYTNKTIPGNLKRGYTSGGGNDTYSDVSYAGVGGIGRNSSGAYGYDDYLGWNIRNKTSLKSVTSGNYTFTYMPTTDYTPYNEGVTLLLIEMVDGFDRENYSYPSGSGYDYLKSFVTSTIKSARVVTQSMRVGEGSERGTLFNIDCDKMNKFFLLAKGQLRWMMNSYWAENSSGTSQLQYTACPEPCYIYRSGYSTAYNGFHDGDGAIPLFSHMFEQFSPVNLSTGGNIDDLYQNLVNMQKFGVYHDCISVPFATTTGNDDDVHGHQFMMYGLDSDAADCQDVRDLIFFVPDYRMTAHSDRDNGNYQKFLNYHPMHQPIMGLFVIRQNEITPTTEANDYYMLKLNWETNLDDFLPGRNQEFELLQVVINDSTGIEEYKPVYYMNAQGQYTDSVGNVVTTPVPIVLIMEAGRVKNYPNVYVKRESSSQQVTYAIRGRDAADAEGKYFLTKQISNRQSYIIPGTDPTEIVSLIELAHYSRYNPDNEENCYSNRFKMSNNVGGLTRGNMSAAQDSQNMFTFTRKTSSTDTNPVTIATATVTNLTDNGGTITIVMQNQAAQTEFPKAKVGEGYAGYHANPGSTWTQNFTYKSGTDYVDFGDFVLCDNFIEDVSANEHPNQYIYEVKFNIEQTNEHSFDEAHGRAFRIPIYKTASKVNNAYSLVQVKSDKDHSNVVEDLTFSERVQYSSKTEILRYDVYRWPAGETRYIVNSVGANDAEQDLPPHGIAGNQGEGYTVTMNDVDGDYYYNGGEIAVSSSGTAWADFVDYYPKKIAEAHTDSCRAYVYAPVVETFTVGKNMAGNARTDYNTYGGPQQSTAVGVLDVNTPNYSISSYSWLKGSDRYAYYNVDLPIKTDEVPNGYKIYMVRAWRVVDPSLLDEPLDAFAYRKTSTGEYMFEEMLGKTEEGITEFLPQGGGGEYQPGHHMSLGANTIPGAVDVNGNNVPVYRGTFGARKVRTNGANDANDGIIDELPMTFRVRLYFTPENTSKAGEQDKTFYIAEYTTDFSIKGGIPTGIVDVMNAKQVVGEKYYNVAGIESDTPFKGVNIVVTRYSDGSTTTTKILK